MNPMVRKGEVLCSVIVCVSVLSSIQLSIMSVFGAGSHVDSQLKTKKKERQKERCKEDTYCLLENVS